MSSEKKQEGQPPMGEKKQMMGKDMDIVYPSGLKLALLMISILVATFMVSLDKLIISTAIPQITDEFNSADDIGWYGTAYLLTNAAFQLLFGKLYKILPVKTTFLTSILLFEAGSALCGAAPNSIAFILGRAIAGLGAGGVLTGVMVVIMFSLPLHKRPRYQGFSGAVFGVSSVLGPTVGGALTTNVSWRWCFYINLPIGAAVMVLVFFLLNLPDLPSKKMSLKDKLQQLNALGLLALVPGVICLCLALQWGGSTYAWNNGRVIALLVVAIVLFIAFALIQVWKPEQATVPPRIFIQRSIASGFWVSLCIGAHQTLFLYYLPLWFQAIQGKTAVVSGTDILPMVLLIVVGFIVNGELVTRIGYYVPSLVFGVCLTAIGAGLLTHLEIDTSEGKWIGYQIVYGFGVGIAGQVPNMAAQTVLAREDIAIGASLMFFGQVLFGAIFTSVGQNVLDNQLASRLASIPGMTAQLIQSTGTTKLLSVVPTEYRATALDAYNDSLRVVFQAGLSMACIAILGAVGMEWRTMKKKMPPKNSGGQRAAEEGKGQSNMIGKQAPEAKVDAVDSEKDEDKDSSATASSRVSTEATQTASQSK